MGVVSPLGQGIESFERGLLSCQSALAPLTGMDLGFGQAPPVGQVRVPVPESPRLSRTDQLALMAAREAAAGADLTGCGVVVSTTVGGLPDIPLEAVKDLPAYYRQGGFGKARAYPCARAAEVVRDELGLTGPQFAVSVACASGSTAIALAGRMIASGVVPAMLAGGSEGLCHLTLCGFHALQAMDFEPCRPFDKSRRGLNIGEGAAFLMLENYERAQARGAVVYGVLRGWAMTNDAYHLTAPHERGVGVAASVRGAMTMAGVSPDEIGFVNAHGTATPLNDVAETKGYENAFAGRGRPMPVSSTKSYFGHCLGAAGSLEAVVTVLGLRSSTLYPTLRLTDPIGSPAVEFVAAPRQEEMAAAASVSAGFGGSNATLVFGR
jgi:3-oxoacyl-[acyl-carrier-protein] synthase II